MPLLLYCANGRVLGWHDSSQSVPASEYGDGVSIIPWTSLSTLSRIGPPPVQVGTIPVPDSRPYAIPTPTIAVLLAYSALKRWITASSGTTVSGIPLTTDDTSQFNISKLKQAFDTGAVTSVEFKAADGNFYTVDASTWTAVYVGVVAHVQACYIAEAAAAAAINGSTAVTYAQVDAFFAEIT